VEPVDTAVLVSVEEAAVSVGAAVLAGEVTVTEPAELGELGVETGLPGVPGAVDAAEIESEVVLEAPSSSFSVIVKGELMARTLLMLETSTN